jgi:glycerophosphoryl diester phosphodiesterase
MIDPVSVSRNGHRTFLKWHRARRCATDPVFTGRRIIEGLALGASVEVDLVRHRDNGLAILHDHRSIASETTGSGPSIQKSAAELRALNLRGNDGAPVADHVMLLEDLCALLLRSPPPPEALLQLDYKEGQGPLPPALIGAFARTVGPVAHSVILSSGEAESVRALAAATPGVRVGHDPCHGDAVEQLTITGDFAGFIEAALAEVPDAEMIYLAHDVLLAADDAGFDLVGAIRADGRRVDAYTLRTADPPDVAIAERLLDLKVDQITTDDPQGLAAALGTPQ